MYIRVHAQPDSKKERIIKESEKVYRIAVKEPAQQNMANKRIRHIIAHEFNVDVTSVTLMTGHRSSSKMYSIEQ